MEYPRWRGPERPVSHATGVSRFRLDRDAGAPGAAREALEPMRGHVPDEVFERTQLCVSEFVTNSVKYGSGPEVRVDVWQDDGTLCLVVSDDGPGFCAQPHDGPIATMPGGYGLPLIDIVATAWGNGTGSDAWAWAEIAPQVEDASPSAASIAQAL